MHIIINGVLSGLGRCLEQRAHVYIKADISKGRCNHLGATIVSLSDSAGTIHDPAGIDTKKLKWVHEHKSVRGATLEPYVGEFGGTWLPGQRPWHLEGDIALPSATQNELDADDAKALVANKVQAVAEGANMPSTNEAKRIFHEAQVLFAPGKAANAGGVAVSGLEISQNRQRQSRKREAIDEELRRIMSHIHSQCVAEGQQNGIVDYSRGADVAGFRRVADAMIAQGRG